MSNEIGTIEIVFNGGGGGGHHPNPTPGNPGGGGHHPNPKPGHRHRENPVWGSVPQWVIDLLPGGDLSAASPAARKVLFAYLENRAEIEAEYARSIQKAEEIHFEQTRRAEVEFLRAILID